MKHEFCQTIALPFLFCFLLTGCAHFEPVAFPKYEPKDYPYYSREGGVEFGVLKFSPEEIKTYFASDLVKKNVWPVRILLVNKGEHAYLFSKGMIEPPVTSSLEAARRGRRSAGHRLFWGNVLIATFFGIPIGIPLVVGGFQALDANAFMEAAFKRNEIQDGELKTGESLSGILFFHRPDLPDAIQVVLFDSKTDEKLKLSVDLTKIESRLAAAPFAGVQHDVSKVELP